MMRKDIRKLFFVLLQLSIAVDSLRFGPERTSADSFCGLPNHPSTPLRPRRMVQGQNTLQNEFPWQVGLKYPRDSKFWCGGSIIHKQWILTAAHCLTGDRPGDILVVVGEHDQSKHHDRAKTYRAKDIIIHPLYNDKYKRFDFALVRLSKPLFWSREVRPICLPEDARVDYAGEIATVSGWGRQWEEPGYTFGHVEEDTDANSDVLKKIDNVRVWSKEKCGEYNRLSRFEAIDICGYAEGRDTCQGDSGGPLATRGSDGRYTLIGVVSHGEGCARKGHPTIYARVTSVLGWIKRWTNEESFAIIGRPPSRYYSRIWN